MANSTEARIAAHVTALADPDERRALRAQRHLVRCYGGRAVDALVAACAADEPAVRWRAASALGRIGDPRAYEALLSLTCDPVDAVRYDAAMALGELGDPRAVDPLVDLIRQTDPGGVANAAANALVRLGQSALPALLRTIEHDSGQARSVAARILGDIGDDSAVGPLAQWVLSSEDEWTRVSGIEALAQLGTPQSFAVLGRYRSDPSGWVRAVATHWYGQLAGVLDSS